LFISRFSGRRVCHNEPPHDRKGVGASEDANNSGEWSTVGIHLNPKIGRDWMLRGHQRRIVTPGKNEKFYLAGARALDVRTGRLHTTGAARKNAELFCQLLWLLASRYRHAERIHLIVDNYDIHKARRTRKVLAALGGRIVLHFLSPTARTRTVSSASGRTSTRTSPAIIAAKPWCACSTPSAATSTVIRE
jgi:hypothetical protein